jgi:hypothetical protein
MAIFNLHLFANRKSNDMDYRLTEKVKAAG